MRRPICLAAGAFAGGIYIQYYFIPDYWFLILLGLIGLLTAFYGRKRNVTCRLLSIFLLFFLIGALDLSVRINQTDALAQRAGTYAVLTGRVLSVEKIDNEKFRIQVKETESGSKVLVSFYGNPEGAGFSATGYGDLVGRIVRISGTIELPAQRRNPKTFDYRRYLMTRGIQTIMSVKPHELSITQDEYHRIANMVSLIRCNFIEKMSDTIGNQTAGIMSGMLFGDKNTMEEDVYELFQKSGTAHILAVSGIHMGILYSCINIILKPRRSIFFNGLLLGSLFFYAALASFSPSVMRASLMIGLHILAKLLCMRYDLFCSGAGVALGMLAVNPLSLFNPGFQLSFLAIFTLAIVLPAALRIKDCWLTMAVVLQIGMVPVTAYSFNTFSWVALLVNIPVVFLAGILIPIGIFLIPVSYLSDTLFGVGMCAVDFLCSIMMGANRLAYIPGVTFFHVTSPPIALLFLFYGLLFFVSSETVWIRRCRKEGKRLAVFSLAILMVGVFAASFPQEDFKKASLVFVDVGQGDCLHIRTPSGKNVLIDGGGSRNYDVGKKILMPYLLKNGVRKIDLALVTHRHADHYDGIVSLAQNLRIGKIGFYEANAFLEEEIIRETGLSADRIAYFSRGQRIVIDKDVWIEVLYPERADWTEYERLTREESDENAISLILKVHYRGVTALMTGDIDMEGERKLMEVSTTEQLDSAILKAGHHGSKYSGSAGFVWAVNPAVTIIQVGKNTFGHPTKEALAAYSAGGTPIFRNDLHGAIGVFIGKGGEEIKIKTIVLENK